MCKVEFLLNTDADTFKAWLLASWPAPKDDCIFPTDKGNASLQALHDWPAGEARELLAAVVYGNERGAYGLDYAVRFRLVTRSGDRVKVWAECMIWDPLLRCFADVLEVIAREYSEMGATLEFSLDGWNAEAEGVQGFEARMQRIRGEPSQEDELERKRLAAAKYPYSLDAEREALLRQLWNDDDLRKEDIAHQLGVSVERLRDYKAMYQLDDRKRGAKPGK